MTLQKQMALFDDMPNTIAKEKRIKQATGTFTPNMKLPVHSWYRYSAGFSAEWAENLIADVNPKIGVLDPFAGSGTTNLAADKMGIKSIGFEPHPFVTKIATAKISWPIDIATFLPKIRKVLSEAQELKKDINSDQPPLMIKCYTEGVLCELIAVREAFFLHNWRDDEHKLKNLVWLCLTSILRECSYVGTATWQYVLPNKRKRNPKKAFVAFETKAIKMAEDLKLFQGSNAKPLSTVIQTDARNPELTGLKLFDQVITSPPYPNNYDYADATRIEMTFWGDVQKWGDLQVAARQYLLRSCSQHATAEKLVLEDLLKMQKEKPIYEELRHACNELAEVRMHKGGKKSYHTMAAAYFLDLGKTFDALRPLCTEGASLCFVIGDSAPYGVMLPTDRWLAELAISSGFKNCRFEKIRDRNIKWKNRKHRVPLKEGYLWFEG